MLLCGYIWKVSCYHVELSQRVRDRYSMIFHMWGIKKHLLLLGNNKYPKAIETKSMRSKRNGPQEEACHEALGAQ